MDALFDPPGAAWQRVSPRLAVGRRIVLGVVVGVAVILLGLTLALGSLDQPWRVVLPVGLVGLAAWGWWLAGRTTALWGYLEADEELFITRGALFRRLVIVPYGRMQYVDVQAGPLDQLLGIASLRLHTASPGTSAVIPGLPAGEAARLRDRLTALGESRAAGL